jgi:hypothetical protein
MNKVEATRLFKEMYPNVYREARTDYCKVQFAWSYFIDSLCKDGQITQSQYGRWTCPAFYSRRK